VKGLKSRWMAGVTTHVPHAAYRLEKRRTLGIVAELLAQAGDADVNRPIERVLCAASGQCEQLLAREHVPSALGQDAQQTELVRRQVKRPPVQRGAQAAGVQGEAPGLDRFARRPRLAARTSHVRPNPGHKLAGREGFGEVVVRADLQTEHPVGFLRARRDHDHRHIRLLAQGDADFDPVSPGEHEVEDHDVGLRAECLAKPLFAVGCVRDRYAVLAQVFGGEAGQALIVFDQEGSDQRIAVVHLTHINPSRP
jgi:hypothetical protein